MLSSQRHPRLTLAATQAISEGSAFLRNIVEFFKGFATVLKFGPFLKLCLATFMVFNGFFLAPFLLFLPLAMIYSCSVDRCSLR